MAVSLILLTAYFGETPNSPLHNVQRGVVEVFSPIEQGASKILSPVRSVTNWFSSTFHAKSQVAALQGEVRSLTSELAAAKGAQIQNAQLLKDVHLDESIGIDAYHPVTGQVILRDPTLWYQTVNIDKGSDDGVSEHDPVIADGALVGEVTEVAANASVVSLITDHTVSVTARVLDANGDTGELLPAVGSPNQLVLEYLQAPNPGQVQTDRSKGSSWSRRASGRGSAIRTTRPTSRSARSPLSTRTTCSTTARCRSRRPPTCGTSTSSRF